MPDRSRRVPNIPAAGISKVNYVNTTELDVARAVFRTLYADAWLEPDLVAGFRWTMDLISCGPVKLTIGQLNGATRFAAPSIAEQTYVVMLSGGAFGEVETGGARYTITPHYSGAVISPQAAIKVSLAGDFLGRNLIIDGGAIKAHLAALTGRTPSAPITFDVPLDLNSRPGAALYGVAQLFRREVDQPDASPLMVAALRDAFLTSLVTGVKHSASGLLDPAPHRIGPGYVKRAEEYIEAHVTEPITLTQIADAVGVPARSLRAAFTTRHGVAPMEFLRRMRFERARRWFMEAPPGTTVVSVVKALGLGDPGRFSVEYKKRFGQTPSQALAGGRFGAGLTALRAAL